MAGSPSWTRICVGLAAAIATGAAVSCGSVPAPSSSSSPTPSGSTGPTTTAQRTATPTPDGFACTDVSGGLASSRPRVISVYTEQHPGYDRFVIQFDAAVPQYTIHLQTSAHFTLTPRDDPITLNGTRGVLVTVQPIGDWTSYGGPTSLAPGYAAITEARLVENFEAVQQWGIALRGTGCLKVTTPGGASLAIDVAN